MRTFRPSLCALLLLGTTQLAFGENLPPYDSSTFTEADFDAWMSKYRDAEPQFIDGDVLTEADRERLDPFVPPGLAIADFYGVDITIKDAGDLSPPQSFLDATAKHAGMATIDANGAIQNYVAGTPFDRTKFTPGSKEDGFRAMWNYNFRWHHYGLRLERNDWVWVDRGGNHDSHEIMSDPINKAAYGGGGTFNRVLGMNYQRINCMNLAMHPDTGYRFPDNWCDGIEWREVSDFMSPFDISGTAFIIYRSADPYKPDDAWAYIPSLRRVRRISAEVKSDSLLGTEDTLEDFYGFAGRIVEWDWEYVGQKKILAIARSRYASPHYGGPNGISQVDNWAVRTVDVVKGKPKTAGHPYSLKIVMFDSQNNIPYYSEAYDRAGKLYKVWKIPALWTEDPQAAELTPKHGAHTPPGTRMSAFQGIDVLNVQNGRATLIPTRQGMSYPSLDLKQAKRALDLNTLTQGR